MALLYSAVILILSSSLLIVASATNDDGGYLPKPNLKKSSSSSYLQGGGEGYGNNGEGPAKNTTVVAVQGVVFCKSGRNKLIPLRETRMYIGAMTRITCLTVDKNGYESSPFSIISQAADNKGYFMATFCPTELDEGNKITECKAFLENSPLKDCKVPTDANKGITGCLLSSYRHLKSKNMKLYTVGPFFYTYQANKTTTVKGH